MGMLTTGAGTHQVPAAATTTTWDPFAKDGSINLDGTKLIVTDPVGGAFAGVRAIASQSSGKFYYEVTATTQNFASFSFFGVGNASAGLSAALGQDANSVVARANGQVDFNGVNIGPWTGAGASGQKLGIAVDLTAKKIWVWSDQSLQWNGDVIGNQNPATGTGGYSFSSLTGPFFPMMMMYQQNDVFTANFGASAYAIGTPPSGFINW